MFEQNDCNFATLDKPNEFKNDIQINLEIYVTKTNE